MKNLSKESSKAVLYAIMDTTGSISDSAHEKLVSQIYRLCVDFAISESRLPRLEELTEIIEKLPGWILTDVIKSKPKFIRSLANALGNIELIFNAATPQRLHIEADAERIFLEDIDSFSRAAKIDSQAASQVSLNDVYEDDVKIALIEIIGERFIPKHSANEKSDLYTSQVILRGRRVPTAFLLKSMRSVKTMDMKSGLGKRSNQILRLIKEPAVLYVVQHTGEIITDVVDHLYAQVYKKAIELQKTLYYYIMDGNETARVLLGYNRI